MIVPQPRMLVWFSLVTLPFATLAGVYPPAAIFCLGIIGTFAVILLVDAAMAFNALHGISVKGPELVRASRDKEAQIEFEIGNSTQRKRSIRIGLALPPVFETPFETTRVAVPGDIQKSRFSWPFTPRHRGNHELSNVYVEAGSPLDFWALRQRFPVGGQIRVYPNLLKERAALAGLFLNRGLLGVHAQRQVGKGRDFEKLREYLPGDGYDEIHWKATAKRGHPVTKVFQIERTQEIYAVIDCSRLSGRPLPDGTAPLLEKYLSAALVLGLAAERQGDLFGIVAFSDRVESFVRARNGRAHYNACRDAVYGIQPRPTSPDFDEVATFLRLRLRRRALLIVLTALDDPVLAESFVRNMNLLCGQHLIVVNMLRPSGVEALFTNTDATGSVDLYDKLRGHLQWANLREVQNNLRKRGVDFALLDDEKFTVELVSRYLSIKQRQVL